MMNALLLGLLAAAQGLPEGVFARDPPQGPMAGEQRTLSQWHRNTDDRMFPDLATREMRIDGDTLYVRIANEGSFQAKGPILVAATAETGGIRSEARPARTAGLKPGEQRWIAVRQFAVKSASAGGDQPLVLLQDADVISALVQQSEFQSDKLDRSGRGCDRCREVDLSNNGLKAVNATIGRGRPE